MDKAYLLLDFGNNVLTMTVFCLEIFPPIICKRDRTTPGGNHGQSGKIPYRSIKMPRKANNSTQDSHTFGKSQGLEQLPCRKVIQWDGRKQKNMQHTHTYLLCFTFLGEGRLACQMILSPQTFPIQSSSAPGKVGSVCVCVCVSGETSKRPRHQPGDPSQASRRRPSNLGIS